MSKLPKKSHDDKGNKVPRSDISHSSSDVDDKIDDNFVSTLSSQEVREIIGVDKFTPRKRLSSLESDASDLEITPKKVRPLKLLDIDLPNNQEIKTSISLSTKFLVTESSSESDIEQNSEDQCPPIVFHKKTKTKHDVIMDLAKKINVEALPTRVITRVRKPRSVLQENERRKAVQNILKSRFLTEQDYDVDAEIIIENIIRLKRIYEKNKNAKDVSKVTKLDETKDKDESKQLHKSKQFNIQDKSQPDESQNIKKESATQIQTETKRSGNAVYKSEDKKWESKRKNTDHVKTLVQLRRNTKTTAPKIKEEKRRGPIMIEPHTITALVKKEKPKKRENKHKNKEPPAKTVNKLENHDFTLETKPETVKVQNVEKPKRTLRSTRARKMKSEDSQESTKIDVDTETEKKPIRRNKSKEASQKRELRRSKRQRTLNDKEVEEPVVKSILKKSATMQVQSTICNLSGSGSKLLGADRNLKRTSEFEAPAPVSKRTRSAANARKRVLRSSPKTYTSFLLRSRMKRSYRSWRN